MSKAKKKPVGAHHQAHRAARLSPFKIRLGENPVESLGLALDIELISAS
jgi:hypothetical protein